MVSTVGTDDFDHAEVLVRGQDGEGLGRLRGWRVGTLAAGDTVTAWVDRTGSLEPLHLPLLGTFALGVTLTFCLALLSFVTSVTEGVLERRAYERRIARPLTTVVAGRVPSSRGREGGEGGYSYSGYGGYGGFGGDGGFGSGGGGGGEGGGG